MLTREDWKRLRWYYKAVHYDIVRKDLLEMLRVRPPLTAKFPILLTCFAGIDFLGLLWKGKDYYKHGSRERSTGFIKNWMAEVRKGYKASEHLPDHLYTFVRCSLAHTASIEGEFVVTSKRSYKRKHLQPTSDGPIILHTRAFTEDFLAAAVLYRRELFSDEKLAVRALDAIDTLKSDKKVHVEETMDVMASLSTQAWSTNQDVSAWYRQAPPAPIDGTSVKQPPDEPMFGYWSVLKDTLK